MTGKAIIEQIEEQIEALNLANIEIAQSESMGDVAKLLAMKQVLLIQHIQTLTLLKEVYKDLKNI